MLTRQIDAIDDTAPDLLVVGGGIHGAWAALEASLRGLRVALVERDDFGSGASANSLKIAHGGFRYVPRVRPDRVRQLASEQANLFEFAPELISALPCVVRTWRRPGRGRVSLWSALKLYRACTAGIDRGPLSGSHLVSRRAVEDLCPALGGDDHTGGALWYEGLIRDTERYVLAVLARAADEGATILNYARTSEFVSEQGRITRVKVHDRLTDDIFTTRPRVVYNATNLPPSSLPDSGREPVGTDTDGDFRYATAFNLIVDRKISQVGIGLESRSSGSLSLNGKERTRVFFLLPWQTKTLLGTGYTLGERDRPAAVGRSEVQSLLSVFNRVAPRLDLSLDEVTHVHVENVPAKMLRSGLRLLGRPELRRSTEWATNVITMVTSRYTTARRAAARGIDECERLLGRTPLGSQTREISSCDLPQARLAAGPNSEISAEFVKTSVSTEMTVRLGDLLLRRTNVGAAGPPDRAIVESTADLMASELGWDEARREDELRRFMAEYPPFVRPKRDPGR